MDIDKLIEAIRLCGSQPNVRQCRNYAYYAGGDMSRCIPRMTADASAALSALRAELEQVKRERDAAYKLLGGEPPKTCKTCVLWGGNGWGQYQIGYCEGDDNPHGPNDFCSMHRGPQEEIAALISPPNDPLTLEELREMDGDKIYIQHIGACKGFFDDEYAPYYGKLEQYVQKYNGMLRACDLPSKYYGEAWLAYRRNPEGGEA